RTPSTCSRSSTKVQGSGRTMAALSFGHNTHPFVALVVCLLYSTFLTTILNNTHWISFVRAQQNGTCFDLGYPKDYVKYSDNVCRSRILTDLISDPADPLGCRNFGEQ
ncbi:unnamed protein product, partial [Amoebophrya sp. A120]